MKNIIKALLVMNIFPISFACTKTGVDPAEKPVKDQFNERTGDTVSYSHWLSAFVPVASAGKICKVISGTPPALTADVLKNGKVLVFGRRSELYKPYSLPYKELYFGRPGHDITIISTIRTYFTDQVARITVYDSLVSRTYRLNYPAPPYEPREFRYIIVPPALKAAATTARLNWNDYTAVASYFKIVP